MKKILVIDDSKTIRTLCEWMFQGLEDTLLTAESGTSARNIINQQSPDVVIVDYTLPDMDPYVFISTIKDRAKVIMLGGTYAPFDANKALSHGAVVTLMKPFKSADFFKAIEDAMTATPAKAEEPVVAPIAPAPSYSSTPIPTNAAAKTESTSQTKSSQANSSSVAPFTQQPSLASAKDFAPIDQHVGPAPIKRFTFPGTESGSKADESQNPATQSETKAEPLASTDDQEIREPKASEQAAPQIDPELIRTEVIAAVKTLLPAIVNTYLKKLIQLEVKPQLQKWVDTRVASLISKMNEHDND
ncbi:MAG: response regulator [Proteobacteria bacterium]|nr:response regulator [Pseudomonadota bacterium]